MGTAMKAPSWEVELPTPSWAFLGHWHNFLNNSSQPMIEILIPVDILKLNTLGFIKHEAKSD